MRFQHQWPGAIIGGTGTPFVHTVEELIGREYEYYDYTDYPDVDYSIGFTQRECRLSCKFCVVPKIYTHCVPSKTIKKLNSPLNF